MYYIGVVNMLPNLVYVGMGKSGSTLLHKLFLKHQDIYVSTQHKEINFFSRENNWEKGVEWYKAMFSGYQGEKWLVDISPGYHNKKKSVARMKEVLGKNVKVIFTFRRFTDFAFSRYLHRIRGKMVRGSFLELLDRKSMFFKPLDVLVGDYVEAFGKENVLIMHYEKEFNRTAPYFERRIYDFLGLSVDDTYYKKEADVKVNSGFYPRFVYACEAPYEEEVGGIQYRVPEDTLVFCSGRPYKNIYWTKRSRAKAKELFELQSSWTTYLDEETYWYVQKKYTEPLARRLEDKLDISFEHWYVDKPKRIEYQQAPLPDAYICDHEILKRRLGYNKHQTPWT